MQFAVITMPSISVFSPTMIGYTALREDSTKFIERNKTLVGSCKSERCILKVKPEGLGG